MSHLTLTTSKHLVKYLCLSIFFVDGLPNSATLTIKIFNHFLKKKKKISLNLNMLIYFKTSYN